MVPSGPYSGKPWGRGFLFLYNASLTPLAEHGPISEHGMRRQALRCVVVVRAVFMCRFTFGQRRQRSVITERRTATQGLPEYGPRPGLHQTSLRDFMPLLPYEAVEENRPFSGKNHRPEKTITLEVLQ